MIGRYKHGIWAGILLALLLSACAASRSVTDSATLQPAGTQAGASLTLGTEIDELFINMMVPHHQGAVEMAKIAQDRSQRPEIQEMANAIIASQQDEITQMKDWKLEWFGSSDTPGLSEMPMMVEMPGMGGMGHTMDMQADVDALRDAQEPFDLAFIDAMIPHHQSAIDTAQLVLQSDVHPEIRELAQSIIDEQQKEIDQMLEWRAAWYPDVSP